MLLIHRHHTTPHTPKHTQRDKRTIEHKLHGKHEFVVFCKLTNIQVMEEKRSRRDARLLIPVSNGSVQLASSRFFPSSFVTPTHRTTQYDVYRNVLALPEFQLLKHRREPCDCGRRNGYACHTTRSSFL